MKEDWKNAGNYFPALSLRVWFVAFNVGMTLSPLSFLHSFFFVPYLFFFFVFLDAALTMRPVHEGDQEEMMSKVCSIFKIFSGLDTGNSTDFPSLVWLFLCLSFFFGPFFF